MAQSWWVISAARNDSDASEEVAASAASVRMGELRYLVGSLMRSKYASSCACVYVCRADGSNLLVPFVSAMMIFRTIDVGCTSRPRV